MSQVKDTIKDGLEAIVGSANTSTEPDVLEKYSRDQSFTPPRKPNYVVKVKTVEEVLAQDVPRCPFHQFSEVVEYGAAPK